MAIPKFIYPGAKTRILDWLMDWIPMEGRRYGEPFAGRGNVFWQARNRRRFESWYLNDLGTCEWLKVLAAGDDWETMLPACVSRLIFESVRAGDLGETVRTVLESELTAYGAGYARSGWIAGKDDSYNRGRLADRFLTCQRLLDGVWLGGRDWARLDWWERWDSRDFIYIDPPYLGTSVVTYNNVDHGALIRAIQSCKARWTLSGYRTEAYVDLLGEPAGIVDVTGAMSVWKGGGESREECVWTSGWEIELV